MAIQVIDTGGNEEMSAVGMMWSQVKEAGVGKMSRGMRLGIRVGLALAVFAGGVGARAEAPAAAVKAFEQYLSGVEARLERQHRSGEAFVAEMDGERVRKGDVVVEELTPKEVEVPGGMLHHWRATAFAAGARAADLRRVMRDYSAYPQLFAPQVAAARVTGGAGDHPQVWMRVRQKHILTVVLDTTYDVAFGQLDWRHGWSWSKSTNIREIADSGTDHEHALSAREEHGFLWRQNTYWSYVEQDGGLLLQVESVSLTRGIPAGLGWAVKPFVESVPRESLEFTLKKTVEGMRGPEEGAPGS